MKRMIGLAAIVAASLAWGAASAQTASSFETDNRAKALGELTDEQVAEALANDGRVAMSGEFFETDSAMLSESSADVLHKLAATMYQMADTRLAVVGHTDSTGPFEHNLELSEARAQAIVAARRQIVDGAVGMVKMALTELDEQDIVDLDEEKKAAMVSNLLVVLCGEENAQPVLNTGSLYN